MKRKVYVILTDTGTIFTRMIKLYTKKPLNHASISFDEQLINVYSFGRKRPRNPFIAGFVKENIRSHLFRNANCAIYCYSITEQQFQMMKKKIKEIEKNKKEYKYNFIGLFAIMMNKELKRKKAFFCSQFVASILQESGLRINENKPASLITPYDIKESGLMNLVYEGKLFTYLKDKKKENVILSKYHNEFQIDQAKVV